MSETTEAPVTEAPTEAPATEAAPQSLRDILSAEYDRASEPAPTERARDESGKFAKAEPTEPTESTDTPKVDAIERPEAWTDAEWQGLNPDVQRAIARRERDLHEALVSRATDTQEVQSYRQVIEPHADRFAAHGLNPVQGVERLLQWEKAMSSNPVQALVQLATLYGVNLGNLTPDLNHSQGNGPATVHDPRLDVILAQQEREKTAAQAREAAAIDAQISAFAADSRNEHFGTVRMAMAGLMQADPKLSLQDAYDRAVWADPAIRQLRQDAAQKAAEADRKRKEADRVAAAKRAGASVRDNPSPGYVNGSGNRSNSLRADLERAWDEAGT